MSAINRVILIGNLTRDARNTFRVFEHLVIGLGQEDVPSHVPRSFETESDHILHLCAAKSFQMVTDRKPLFESLYAVYLGPQLWLSKQQQCDQELIVELEVEEHANLLKRQPAAYEMGLVDHQDSLLAVTIELNEEVVEGVQVHIEPIDTERQRQGWGDYTSPWAESIMKSMTKDSWNQEYNLDFLQS